MSNLSAELQAILDRHNLTIYGASQIVGSHTDKGLKTVHERLSRWMRQPPKTWEDITATLDALGYKITIEPTENDRAMP